MFHKGTRVFHSFRKVSTKQGSSFNPIFTETDFLLEASRFLLEQKKKLHSPDVYKQLT